jgi:hypothetical protein
MNDYDLDEMDRNVREIGERFDRTEQEGLKNLLKHFDRLHDNLFSFNNILIAGFFALSQFGKKVSPWTIIIPLINLCILVFIEYRMMNKCRFEAAIKSKTPEEINKWGKGISNTNLYSLLSIVTTVIVTVVFLIYLI